LPSCVSLQRSNVKPMLLSALLGTGNHYVDFFDEEMLNVGFHGWLRWPPNGICVNAQPLLWFQTPRKSFGPPRRKQGPSALMGRDRAVRGVCTCLPHMPSAQAHPYIPKRSERASALGLPSACTHWFVRL